MSITEKIERKMTALEHLMNAQMHIMLPHSVSEAIDGLSSYWEHLSEENRDYVELASAALLTKAEWKV